MVLSFTPPSVSEVPPVLPEGDPDQSEEAFRLYRFFKARPAGRNVYMYKAGSLSALAHGRVDETDPVALYDSSGQPISDGWEDLELVFWGGHNRVIVTSEQAVALIAAGYTVIDDGVPTVDPPTISSLAPSSGIAGTSVSILGDALIGATDVSVDGASVSFTVVSSAQVTFTTPAHADGSVSVQITTPYGSDSHAFLYSTPAPNTPPVIGALTPSMGAVGQVVTIAGTNFSNVTVVHFGTNAAAFSIGSSTSIIATAPAHADGSVSVTVTDAIGTSNAVTFTYTTAPPSDPHPGSDLLLEDGSFLLLEDGASSIQQEA